MNVNSSLFPLLCFAIVIVLIPASPFRCETPKRSAGSSIQTESKVSRPK